MKNKCLINFLLFAGFLLFLQVNIFSFSFNASARSAAVINDEEKRSLEHITEEVKLARDFAVLMGSKHNSDFFNKIGETKQSDLDKLKDILESKNIDDPVKNDESGIYKSENFTDLYKGFTESGNTNISNALKAGAEISELQISDCNKFLNIATDQEIKDIFSLIKKNSEKNLKSYINQLSQKGIGYIPKHLTSEDFNKILN